MASLGSLLETTVSLHGPTLLSGAATDLLAARQRAAIKIGGLDARELADVQKHCPGVELVQDYSDKFTTQHGKAGAVRVVADQRLHQLARLGQGGHTVLAIGSTSAEISRFFEHTGAPIRKRDGTTVEAARVEFHLYGRETKDCYRMCNAADLVVSRATQEIRDVVNAKRRDKRYRGHSVESVARAVDMALGAGTEYGRVHVGPYPRANTIVGRDVGYNCTEADWVRIFGETGANEAIITMYVPWELEYPEMPAHDWHNFVRDVAPGCAAITWPKGWDSGYVHQVDTWSLLSRKHYLRGKHENIAGIVEDVVVQVEITDRYGPMSVIRLWRVWQPSAVLNRGLAVRQLVLPPCFDYVRVLDLVGSVDSDGNVGSLRYISVLKSEFFQVTNHCLSVKEGALTLAYVMSAINRYAPGVIFGGSGGIKKWDLESESRLTLAVTVFAYVANITSKVDDVLPLAGVEFLDLRRRLRGVGNFVVAALSLGIVPLMRWLRGAKLADKLLLKRCGDRYVAQRCPVVAGGVPPEVGATEDEDPNERARRPPEVKKVEEDTESEGPPTPSLNIVSGALKEALGKLGTRSPCWLCSAAEGRIGRQRLECHHCADSNWTFDLGKERWEGLRGRFREALAEEVDTPEALRKVIDRAYETCKDLHKEYGQESGCARNSHICRVERLEAGPGTGKSHMIKLLATRDSAIVLPIAELRSDYTGANKMLRCGNASCAGYPFECSCGQGTALDERVKTPHHAIYAFRGKYVDTVFVDEAFSMDMDLINAVVLAARPQKLVLVGDSKQYLCRSEHGCSALEFFGEEGFSRLSRHHLLVNFRLPGPVVDLLNRRFGYSMEAASEEAGPGIRVAQRGQVQLSEREIYGRQMCFTYDTARAEFPEEADAIKSTVRKSQGKTYDHAILHLTAADYGHVTSVPASNVVALSRCRKELLVLHDGSDDARSMLAHLGLDGTNFGFLTAAVVGAQPASVAVKVDQLEDNHRPSVESLPVDAFKDLPEIIAQHDGPVGLSPNELVSQMVRQEASRAEIRAEDMLTPLSASGREVRQVRSARVLCSAPGRSYWQNPGQLLNVACVRYGGKSRSMRPGAERDAADVVKHYRRNYMNEELRALPFEVVENVCAAVVRDNERKGVPAMVNGKTFCEKDLVAAVHFSIKLIVKPDNGKTYGAIDLEKVGQGISAWGKDATLVYACVARCMEKWFELNQRRDDRVWVTTDDGKSDEEFVAEVQARIAEVPQGAAWKLTDGVMFDSQQDEFTQHVEREAMRLAGIPEDIIAGYYSFRKEYEIVTPFFRLFASYQKTSGEPWTKGGNGWVARALSLYILDLVGPHVVIYKGDDFAVYGFSRENASRRAVIEQNTALEIRVVDTAAAKVYPEFCGYAVVAGALVPSVVRRAVTLAVKRFGCYEHFAEVQSSTRNFIGFVQRLGVARVLAADAQRLQLPFEFVERFWFAIVSLSHVGRQQFEEHWAEIEVRPVWAGLDDNHEPILVEGVGTETEPSPMADSEVTRLVAAREAAKREFTVSKVTAKGKTAWWPSKRFH